MVDGIGGERGVGAGVLLVVVWHCCHWRQSKQVVGIRRSRRWRLVHGAARVEEYEAVAVIVGLGG